MRWMDDVVRNNNSRALPDAQHVAARPRPWYIGDATATELRRPQHGRRRRRHRADVLKADHQRVMSAAAATLCLGPYTSPLPG